MGFSRQECWGGLPFPSPGDLPDPGIKHGSPTLQANALLFEPPVKPRETLKQFDTLKRWFSHFGGYQNHVGDNKTRQVPGPSPMSLCLLHQLLRCFSRATQMWASLVAQTVKHLPAMWGTGVQFLGREDPLEKEMAIHSSTLAWKIPWTEEPDRLQSMGSQRVGHN